MILEELLNTLIKRGWKPFWRETRHELSSWVVYDTIDIEWKWDIRVIDRRHHHIRELVSKESGLWQFVCENKKLHNFPQIRIKNPTLCDEWIKDVDKDCNDNFYEYWLIECALRDESELEKFLLDNIKIDGE